MEDLIGKRISQLQGYLDEEGGGSISKDSLTAFYAFHELLMANRVGIPESLVRELASPAISLTPDNDIYANWDVDGKHYGFHFVALHEIRWCCLPAVQEISNELTELNEKRTQG